MDSTSLWVSTMAIKVYCFVLVALFALASAKPVNQHLQLKDAPREVVLRPHKKFELDCVIESGDKSGVKYEWQKNGESLKPSPKIALSGSKLVFNDPTLEDAGEYRCLAASPAGVTSTRPIFVGTAFLDAPKFTPQRVKPVEGKPLKLECNVPKAFPEPTIEWKKEFNDGKTDDVLDGRITISSEGDLYFTNATQEDVSKNFKYICVAKTPAVDKDVKLAEYTVESLEKNPKPDNEAVQLFVTPDQHTITVGDRAFLYCIYGSSPQAYPVWHKDGVHLDGKPDDRVTRHNRSKGKRLLIKEVRPEDQGTYTCVIDNELGKQQKYSFYVNVVSAPKFNKTETQIVQEGPEAFIPCEVISKPSAAITWYFNAKVLDNSRASANATGLLIKKLRKEDEGYYGCLARNKHGVEYVETFLQVV